MKVSKRKIKKAIKRLRGLPLNIILLKYLGNKLYGILLKVIKSTKVPFPSTILIEVTNHCNLHCQTCPREYRFGENMDKGYMNINNLIKIVDEVYPYIDSITLTGLGEPLLYKDIIAAAAYIRRKNTGIIISLSINAHLKNSVEISKRLLRYIDSIQISVDGIGDVYNKIRTGGSYSFFYNNLKDIVSSAAGTNTDIILNMVLVKDNYHQMEAMVELAHSLGISYLNMNIVNIVSITNEDYSYYSFFQTENFKKELSRAKRAANKIKNFELILPNMETHGTFSDCSYPWGYYFITWNGYIVPCCAKPFPKEKNFGNVISSNIMSVLNSSDFRNFRTMWFNNEIPEFCKNCLQVYS